jgi:hypothetical protein
LANCIFLPFIYFFYPETSGRTPEELDVVFAHAHIVKRRPTLIAAELPKLTDHQILTLTDRYDIHGGATETEAPGTFGAPVNAGEPDTTLPPAHPSDLRTRGNAEHDQSELSTRVPTPTGLPTEVKEATTTQQ